MVAVKSNSLIRKFAIIFVGVALLPFVILYYLYAQFEESEKLADIFSVNFGVILIVVGIMIILGFFFVRITIKKIILLRNAVQSSATTAINEADEKVMLELARGDGEIADLAKSFLNIIKQNESKEIQHEEKKITPPAIPKNISKKQDVPPDAGKYDLLIKDILENLTDAVGARHGALFFFENDLYALKSWASRDKIIQEQVVADAQEYFGQIDKEKLLFLPHKSTENNDPVSIFSPPLACSPLIYNGAFLGVLFLSGNIYWKSMDNFSSEHLSIILTVSGQIAASLEHAQADANSDQALFEAMVALAQAVEARDPYSRGHAGRVSKCAQKTGELMGLMKSDIEAIRDASLLHDIGKRGIKYNILFKSGKLAPNELQAIRTHPIVGEMMVAPLKSYKHLLVPIRHHHEQLDGSGYPDGLKSKKISLITKIISVANIYDVLLMQRSYRPRMDHAEVKRQMDDLVKSGKIDKDIVQQLHHAVKMLDEDKSTKTKPDALDAMRLPGKAIFNKDNFLRAINVLRKNKGERDSGVI